MISFTFVGIYGIDEGRTEYFGDSKLFFQRWDFFTNWLIVILGFGALMFYRWLFRSGLIKDLGNPNPFLINAVLAIVGLLANGILMLVIFLIRGSI